MLNHTNEQIGLLIVQGLVLFFSFFCLGTKCKKIRPKWLRLPNEVIKNKQKVASHSFLLIGQSDFDWVLYSHHGEFPIHEKIIPILTCPIDTQSIFSSCRAPRPACKNNQRTPADHPWCWISSLIRPPTVSACITAETHLLLMNSPQTVYRINGSEIVDFKSLYKYFL